MSSSEQERLLLKISRLLEQSLLIQRMVHREQIEQQIGHVLGDGTRRKIYEMCDGTNTVGEMAEALNISSPAVSQHLNILAKAELVEQQDSPPRRYIKRLEV